MYGYGYRYPKVKRKVEVLYKDPEYMYQWARAAVLNQALANKNPWISFLRSKNAFQDIGKKMKQYAQEYRATHYLQGLPEKVKKAAQRRLDKLLLARNEYLTPDILSRLPANKYTQ
jgi:uncharacterized Fe-S radical SAM superfamily protein PflX